MLSSVNALNRNLRIEEKPKAKKKTPKAKKKTSKAIVNLTKAETNESEASISHSTKRKRTRSMTSEAPESSKLGLKNPRFDPFLNENSPEQQHFLQDFPGDSFSEHHTNFDLGLEQLQVSEEGIAILEDERISDTYTKKKV
ncbi:hypothetical protein HMI55_000820 [Coelomomyces lativittatus]|nr:hypothetical protein HMI55_000820 [Coelomomyces lativittatus]